MSERDKVAKSLFPNNPALQKAAAQVYSQGQRQAAAAQRRRAYEQQLAAERLKEAELAQQRQAAHYQKCYDVFVEMLDKWLATGINADGWKAIDNEYVRLVVTCMQTANPECQITPESVSAFAEQIGQYLAQHGVAESGSDGTKAYLRKPPTSPMPVEPTNP